MQINVYTDGGARGNPGPAGFGLVIYDDKKQNIYQESKYLGIKTNNEAEYSALIASLSWILENKDKNNITAVNFYSDSQLLIRQIQGKYRVKAKNLLGYFYAAKELLQQINLPFKYHDIRRELNIIADRLANQAMDKRQ